MEFAAMINMAKKAFSLVIVKENKLHWLLSRPPFGLDGVPCAAVCIESNKLLPQALDSACKEH